MNKNNVLEWKKKANADLDTVDSLLKINNFHAEIVCFHCQQAIEKYFKAYLCLFNNKIPRTHDLDTLLQRCLSIDNDFNKLDRMLLSKLTDYAVDFRYPDDLIETSIEDVN